MFFASTIGIVSIHYEINIHSFNIKKNLITLKNHKVNEGDS